MPKSKGRLGREAVRVKALLHRVLDAVRRAKLPSTGKVWDTLHVVESRIARLITGRKSTIAHAANARAIAPLTKKTFLAACVARGYTATEAAKMWSKKKK